MWTKTSNDKPHASKLQNKRALKLALKALSHGAIFLETCNAILLLRDVN